jgi:hypothetical protein
MYGAPGGKFADPVFWGLFFHRQKCLCALREWGLRMQEIFGKYRMCSDQHRNLRYGFLGNTPHRSFRHHVIKFENW